MGHIVDMASVNGKALNPNPTIISIFTCLMWMSCEINRDQAITHQNFNITGCKKKERKKNIDMNVRMSDSKATASSHIYFKEPG